MKVKIHRSLIKRYNESDHHLQLSFLVSLRSSEGDRENTMSFYFYFHFLQEIEDIVTLCDDKSNNDSNLNIVICSAMCSFLTSKQCVSKIILDASFEFRSKDKYERKMLDRLKRNFKRKIYMNSFYLMPQVFIFLWRQQMNKW